MIHTQRLTKVVAFGLMGTALLFAGCTIPGTESEKGTSLVAPTEKTQENAALNTAPAPTAELVATDADFDAKVQSAMLKYIATNRSDFGKEVVDSANAYQQQAQAAEEAEKAESVKNVPGIKDADHILGDANAKFVLFEYSDYQCPFCQRFHPTSKDFIENNADVALVFRGMPLDQLHPKARGIHEVAECVADLGGNDAFWKFTDSVFDQEVTSNEDYQAAAKKAGITDEAALKECVNSGKHKATIAASSQEGASLGIQGTPTSILKNTETGEVRLIGGAYPLEALESALAELK